MTEAAGLAREDQKLRKLVDDALARGASSATIVPVRDIFVDKRARLKCLVPRCSCYGSHLMCPPSIMPVKEFREILGLYHHALLLQVEAEADSSDKSPKGLDGPLCDKIESETAARKWQLKLLRAVGGCEAAAFKMGFYYAAGLSGGECCLCDECVGANSSEGCRHPFEARPSMEAMGIDVIKTCKKAGMPVLLSSKAKVRWTGLVLID